MVRSVSLQKGLTPGQHSEKKEKIKSFQSCLKQRKQRCVSILARSASVQEGLTPGQNSDTESKKNSPATQAALTPVHYINHHTIGRKSGLTQTPPRKRRSEPPPAGSQGAERPSLRPQTVPLANGVQSNRGKPGETCATRITGAAEVHRCTRPQAAPSARTEKRRLRGPPAHPPPLDWGDDSARRH